MADNNDWNEDRLMAGRCQDEDGANLMALGSNNKKKPELIDRLWFSRGYCHGD